MASVLDVVWERAAADPSSADIAAIERLSRTDAALYRELQSMPATHPLRSAVDRYRRERDRRILLGARPWIRRMTQGKQEDAVALWGAIIGEGGAASLYPRYQGTYGEALDAALGEAGAGGAHAFVMPRYGHGATVLRFGPTVPPAERRRILRRARDAYPSGGAIAHRRTGNYTAHLFLWQAPSSFHNYSPSASGSAPAPGPSPAPAPAMA